MPVREFVDKMFINFVKDKVRGAIAPWLIEISADRLRAMAEGDMRWADVPEHWRSKAILALRKKPGKVNRVLEMITPGVIIASMMSVSWEHGMILREHRPWVEGVLNEFREDYWNGRYTGG